MSDQVYAYETWLKQVQNREQLMALLAAMNKSTNLALFGKRRGYHAFDFTEHPHKPGYAHYLFDDGVSTGCCRWGNLWRVLAVR